MIKKKQLNTTHSLQALKNLDRFRNHHKEMFYFIVIYFLFFWHKNVLKLTGEALSNLYLIDFACGTVTIFNFFTIRC